MRGFSGGVVQNEADCRCGRFCADVAGSSPFFTGLPPHLWENVLGARRPLKFAQPGACCCSAAEPQKSGRAAKNEEGRTAIESAVRNEGAMRAREIQREAR